MAGLPDVVKRVTDDIQWTTDLGNAFLADQQRVTNLQLLGECRNLLPMIHCDTDDGDILRGQFALQGLQQRKQPGAQLWNAHRLDVGQRAEHRHAGE